MFYLFVGLFFFVLLAFSFISLLYFFNSYLILELLTFGGSHWLINFEFDDCRLGVLTMLLICFLYVFFYTGHYFGGRVAGIDLNQLICLFVGVMATLVCTGDYLLTLVLWEYLGVVSYFLILFYDRYLSLRSSIITLVSSRFGDVCLFVLICLGCYCVNSFWPAAIIFFLIIFTKRAGFPFVRWLLEAMRAPTPVRSLVHSSTLVAAGVWFSMRYDFLQYFKGAFVFSLPLLVTIIITGLCCFFFIDLKKIVALSTCNKISWCVFYLIFGDFLLSLFQLIRHGVSKCVLFMLVGDVMRGSSGSQASNAVYGPYLYGNWGIFGLFRVVLGLSGAPFIGVFFTKHFLLSGFMGVTRATLYMTVLVCAFLSYFYSFRLCSILLNLNVSAFSGVLFCFNSGLMVYFWLIVNYFITLKLDEAIELNNISGTGILLFQLVSCATAYWFYSRTIIRHWRSRLFGCDKIVELFYDWFSYSTTAVGAFFYRWDNFSISLFKGTGVKLLSRYSVSLLKIVFLCNLLILVCWCIVYK